MKRGKLMSLADIYGCFNKYGTTESEETYVEPNPSGSTQCPSWEGNYETLRTQPTYYRLNQYMSPYISSHWESSSPVMRTMNDMSLLPPLSDKIDPNKIFNSDITALNATAADQLRTLKAFEKKFMESINDKNKFGLTEDDVAAFQAITAARNAITSINKEKIAVKKNIADIKIKQQQNQSNAAGQNHNDAVGSTLAPTGTSVLDSIFKSLSSNDTIPTQAPADYIPASVDSAEALIDEISNPNLQIEREQSGIHPAVIVRDNVNDAYFANVDSNNNIVEDQSALPDVPITNVDLMNSKANDELGRRYDVIKLGNEVL